MAAARDDFATELNAAILAHVLGIRQFDPELFRPGGGAANAGAKQYEIAIQVYQLLQMQAVGYVTTQSMAPLLMSGTVEDIRMRRLDPNDATPVADFARDARRSQDLGYSVHDIAGALATGRDIPQEPRTQQYTRVVYGDDIRQTGAHNTVYGDGGPRTSGRHSQPDSAAAGAASSAADRLAAQAERAAARAQRDVAEALGRASRARAAAAGGSGSSTTYTSPDGKTTVTNTVRGQVIHQYGDFNIGKIVK